MAGSAWLAHTLVTSATCQAGTCYKAARNRQNWSNAQKPSCQLTLEAACRSLHNSSFGRLRPHRDWHYRGWLSQLQPVSLLPAVCSAVLPPPPPTTSHTHALVPYDAHNSLVHSELSWWGLKRSVHLHVAHTHHGSHYSVRSVINTTTATLPAAWAAATLVLLATDPPPFHILGCG
jgi:hypothetical protein